MVTTKKIAIEYTQEEMRKELNVSCEATRVAQLRERNGSCQRLGWGHQLVFRGFRISVLQVEESSGDDGGDGTTV